MRRKQSDILTVKRVSGIPSVRIVSGTGIINSFPKHVHPDFCFGIITGGQRMISVNGKSEILCRDDIFVINPGEPHICSSQENTAHSYHVMIVENGFLCKIKMELSADAGSITFENFIKSDKYLSSMLKELVYSLVNSEMFIEQQGRFYSFIEMMIRHHSGNIQIIPEFKKRSNIICNVKDFIDNNYTDEISLEMLSQLSGISPFHLNRLFCIETGISPHTYQIHRRIERSKEHLLKNSSIASVSLEMGFSDQSHFSKFFRRIVGTTPGNYIRHNALRREDGNAVTSETATDTN